LFLALDTLLMVVAGFTIGTRTGPHPEDWSGVGIVLLAPAGYGCIAAGLFAVCVVSGGIRRGLIRRRSAAAVGEASDTSTR
jgi:hypothetical protein